MPDWFDRTIVDAGKLPLLFCGLGYVVGWIVTRTIVRRIRSGEGRLSDVSVGGIHVHHMVPGVVIVLAAGLIALTAPGVVVLTFAGLLFGIGMALVLDEFALLLDLEDVYWSERGLVSLDAIFLALAFVIVLIVGVSPLGIEEMETGESLARWITLAMLLLRLFTVAVAFAKGKLVTGFAGVFVPFVALIGAVRLARPRSLWAHLFYRDKPEKEARARRRLDAIGRRWGPTVRRFEYAVAGRPSDVDPTGDVSDVSDVGDD